MTKASTITTVTSLFAEVRAAASDKLAGLPAIHQQQTSDAQATVDAAQLALAKAQAALAALPTSQAAEIASAQAEITTIDQTQAEVLAELTANLPADPADATAVVTTDPAAPVAA